MHCPKCYRENDPGTGYCAFCGHEFGSATPTKGRFQFKKQEKKPRTQVLKQEKPVAGRSFDPASVARREHDSRVSEAKIINESSGESDRLKSFKERHKIEEIFKPYEGKIKIEQGAEGSVLLIMGNRSIYPFRVRITGMGNPFYNEYRMRPFQRKKVVLQPGKYNTISYLENWGIRWLSPVTRDETHHYTRNPLDSSRNANSRLFTLEPGKYTYYCRSRNPLRNIGIPRIGRV